MTALAEEAVAAGCFSFQSGVVSRPVAGFSSSNYNLLRSKNIGARSNNGKRKADGNVSAPEGH